MFVLRPSYDLLTFQTPNLPLLRNVITKLSIQGLVFL